MILSHLFTFTDFFIQKTIVSIFLALLLYIIYFAKKHVFNKVIHFVLEKTIENNKWVFNLSELHNITRAIKWDRIET